MYRVYTLAWGSFRLLFAERVQVDCSVQLEGLRLGSGGVDVVCIVYLSLCLALFLALTAHPCRNASRLLLA